ncbi:hypothetical protein M6B38_223980 [Iris pallida]|uniref:Uncharacterized protein n=1 Tax=Iris pallida TaxID=29817 RepID=A0AAX6DW71_IRIPA|nr:hypothetical protein M6B38_223980 [Iris pallida]
MNAAVEFLDLKLCLILRACPKFDQIFPSGVPGDLYPPTTNFSEQGKYT